MVRPFALFAREPIVQVFGLYMMLVYGIFYRKFTIYSRKERLFSFEIT